MKRIFSAIGAVFPLFLLASLAAGAEPGLTDPCRLVTKQEAQVTLGAPISSSALNSPPARRGEAPVRICSFMAQNGKILNVFIGSRTKAAFDREKKGMPSVAGIGDDAYAVGTNVVAARKGETEVIATVLGADDPRTLESLKALARTAIGRL